MADTSLIGVRSNGGFAPDTDGRRELVREQLERVLASAAFRNSKRYAAVLRYIVEQTMKGAAESLKERTIGVDVFGREPDYDTASDHAVRSAMSEVRKRLAQYYQEDPRAGELRFELQPGSYVPLFRLPPAPVPAAPPPGPVPLDAAVSAPPEPQNPSRLPPPPATGRRWLFAAIAGGIAICGAALALTTIRSDRDPLADFWAPVLTSPGPVLLCVGTLDGPRASDLTDGPNDLRTLTMNDFHHLASQTVHISDAAALARFAGLLDARKKSWRIATQSKAGLGDLGTGPAVLIGLMNNGWTERMVGQLRFRVERPAPHKVVIRDNREPSRGDWSMDYSTPLLNVTTDYALVLRLLDPNTGQMVVAAGGISVFGTLAAAEFLTKAGELEALDALAPDGWKRKNVELVLSTEVVRAESGRPRIVASHIW